MFFKCYIQVLSCLDIEYLIKCVGFEMVFFKRVNNKIGFIGKRQFFGNGNILDRLRIWINIREKVEWMDGIEYI